MDVTGGEEQPFLFVAFFMYGKMRNGINNSEFVIQISQTHFTHVRERESWNWFLNFIPNSRLPNSASTLLWACSICHGLSQFIAYF